MVVDRPLRLRRRPPHVIKRPRRRHLVLSWFGNWSTLYVVSPKSSSSSPAVPGGRHVVVVGGPSVIVRVVVVVRESARRRRRRRIRLNGPHLVHDGRDAPVRRTPCRRRLTRRERDDGLSRGQDQKGAEEGTGGQEDRHEGNRAADTAGIPIIPRHPRSAIRDSESRANVPSSADGLRPRPPRARRRPAAARDRRRRRSRTTTRRAATVRRSTSLSSVSTARRGSASSRSRRCASRCHVQLVLTGGPIEVGLPQQAILAHAVFLRLLGGRTRFHFCHGGDGGDGVVVVTGCRKARVKNGTKGHKRANDALLCHDG